MKAALKRFDTYLYSLIGIIIGMIPFFIQMIIYFIPNRSFNFSAYPFVIWVIVAVFFLCGIIIPDIYTIRYRKKADEWDDDLPVEIKAIFWRIKTPFWLSAAVLFTFVLTLEIVIRITNACGGVGHYPFL